MLTEVRSAGLAATEVGELFASARIELDRRDAANSAALRYRHSVTAWFFLNEGWRRLHGGDALRRTRH